MDKEVTSFLSKVRKLKEKGFKAQLKEWFRLQTTFDWIKFGTFLISLIGFILIIVDFLVSGQKDGVGGLWKVLDKFTHISSVLTWFTLYFLIFKKGSDAIRIDRWIFHTAVYSFFTFVGYNLILIPLDSSFDYGNQFSSNVFVGFKSVWLHVINTISYIAFSIYYIRAKRLSYVASYFRYLARGMIFVTFYALYLIIIPFLASDGGSAYSIYGSVTNTKENTLIALLTIAAIYFLFFPLSYLLFYGWLWFNNVKRKLDNLEKLKEENKPKAKK